jgi:hypothetical protein
VREPGDEDAKQEALVIPVGPASAVGPLDIAAEPAVHDIDPPRVAELIIVVDDL